jgi:hypothetical protein
LLDGDEGTREQRTFSFVKMGGPPRFESKLIGVHFTLLSSSLQGGLSNYSSGADFSEQMCQVATTSPHISGNRYGQPGNVWNNWPEIDGTQKRFS